MVVKVVVLALSKSGENTARSIAEKFDVPLHGRIDRVENADVYFGNSLEHIRDLFLAGYSIVGVCASGILIRAVAPFISDKKADPPLVSVAEDVQSLYHYLVGIMVPIGWQKILEIL